ncbi:MAG: DUF4203 domain-containing protein [Spirochaetia bacterium]
MYQITNAVYDYLYSLSTASGVSTGVIAIILGGLLILLGYKLKRIALVLVGVLFGASLGAYLAEMYLPYGTAMYIALPIIIAVVLGVASFILYYLAVYVLGLAVGGAIGIFIAYNYIDQMVWGLVIAVVLALILGSVTLATEKPIVILATSFVGYVAFRLGLYLVLPLQESVIIEIVCVVFGIAGVVVQFGTNKGRHSRIKREVRYVDTKRGNR